MNSTAYLEALEELRPIVVQKFGGTSVATAKGRSQAAHRVIAALQEGSTPVVVVSAMGRGGDPYATDTLLELAGHAGERELALIGSCGEIISAVVMASTLNALGQETVVLTGGQAGIVTNDTFTGARILRVNPERIVNQVCGGKTVIVTGFQGSTVSGETTTLGRGGSDITAAALGVTLEADVVEIYTDVAGVKTADPGLVPDAKTLTTITYEELAQMAHAGARVLHPRAVEMAMNGDLPLRIRPISTDKPGTLVTRRSQANVRSAEFERPRVITGVTHVPNQTQFVVDMEATGSCELDVELFERLAGAGISLDLINVYPDRKAFLVHEEQTEQAQQMLRELKLEPVVRQNCAKVSVVGMGMHGVPGVMARVVQALSGADVQILQTADSHSTISCLIDGNLLTDALRALTAEFKLNSK